MLEPLRNKKGFEDGPAKPLTSYDRLPPQNTEAEQSVLGAVLIENEAIGTVIEHLSPNDFYKESHKKIFLSMLELYDHRNKRVDQLSGGRRWAPRANVHELVGGG